MDTTKKQSGILYTEKNKAVLYVTGAQNPMVMQFPRDIVKHLEIVDETKFQQLIVHFLVRHELKPMNLLIVLGSDITFEKELDNTPLSLLHVEEEKFLDIVPFHQIITKTFRINGKAYIIASNRSFTDKLIDTLHEESFSVLGVVPFSMMHIKLPELKTHADLPQLLKKIDTFKHYNLHVELEQQERKITYNVPSLKHPQFIALISVFILLLVILVIQVYTQFLSVQSKPKTTPKTIPVIKVLSTPTASPSAEITPQE